MQYVLHEHSLHTELPRYKFIFADVKMLKVNIKENRVIVLIIILVLLEVEEYIF